MKILLAILPLLLLAVILCGCRTRVPTWSKARPDQRAAGFFKPDDAYRASPEYKASIAESAENVKRLRVQLRNE
jgi:hypothetical protein